MSYLTGRIRRWCALPAVLFIAACGNATEPEPIVPLDRSSEHFDFTSNTARASEAEMDLGIAEAEAHWAAISALLGPELTPGTRITVLLDG